MHLIQPDTATAHMNELQFMDECILQSLSYEEYAESAKLCTKYVHSQDAFSDRIESMAAEERYWNDMADEIAGLSAC